MTFNICKSDPIWILSIHNKLLSLILQKHRIACTAQTRQSFARLTIMHTWTIISLIAFLNLENFSEKLLPHILLPTCLHASCTLNVLFIEVLY